MVDYTLLLKKFWKAFAISVHLYEGDKLLHRYASDDFSPNPAINYIQPYLSSPHTISFVVSPDYLMIGLIKLTKTNRYLIVGPAAPFKFSRTNILSILSNMNLPPSRADELQLALHYMPQIQKNNFSEVLKFLNTILNEENDDEPIEMSFKPKLDFLALDTQIIESQYNFDYSLEKKILTYIQHGRINELKEAISEMNNSSMSIATLADNIIRSLKNTAIGSIAICSRASMSGGLSYHTAMSLTDYYISKVEAINNFNEITELIMTMMLDFAQRNKRIDAPHDMSNQLKEIFQLIDGHIYSKITTSDLSKKLHISSSHICHLVKSETGMTVTDCIHRRKIKEACYLLETTDLSIIDIANQLGYSSQQHFHKVFRQIMGITPKLYDK